MRRQIMGYLVMLALGLAAGGGLAYLRTQEPEALQAPAAPEARLPALPAGPNPTGSNLIADLVERAGPAVVNIDTITRERRPALMLDPFQDFFGGQSPFGTQEHVQKGVGSGFIIDGSGVIVTNNHVIKNASQLTVTLEDGRKFPGKILGRDPATDVAVVKIDGKQLPTLPLGESHNVRVGEWVVAIGSPLGLSKTVTAGIVSALNRDVQISERVSFIQTDAAINPGNSGGPLIDMRGRVIGVNTAIAAQAQGIGFAIPSDTARSIVDQLRTKGKVERAWIGVSIAELTPERAEQLFSKMEPGVLVRQVVPGGPADRSGIREGDVLIEVDARKLEKPGDLIRYLAGKRVGEKVSLLVSREGQRKTLSVSLGAMPDNAQAAEPEE